MPGDPPGFYIDEASIAYNAHSISQTGHDEHGVSWPLYFRAFGEYKNPVYIYALAAIFKVTGPRIRVARLFSALLGALACLLLGYLAWRLSRRLSISIIIFLSALLTPWLYESSRLVFEVAAYPAVTVLFLLALQRAAAKLSSDAAVVGVVGTYHWTIARAFVRSRTAVLCAQTQPARGRAHPSRLCINFVAAADVRVSTSGSLDGANDWHHVCGFAQLGAHDCDAVPKALRR